MFMSLSYISVFLATIKVILLRSLKTVKSLNSLVYLHERQVIKGHSECIYSGGWIVEGTVFYTKTMENVTHTQHCYDEPYKKKIF